MPVIVAIAGPSGAGKTVLSNKLKDEGFAEIVSVTTRQPRKGEVDGVAYNFLSREQFLDLEKNNGLIESIEMNGNFYGVPAKEALKHGAAGKPIVVVAEPHGIEQIDLFCKKNNWECLKVFVNSPTDVLMERLLDRFNNDVETLDKSSETYNSDYKKVLKTYSSRINHVMGKEQEEWVKPAYSENSIFDIKFDSFNKETENKVLQQVKYNVDILLDIDSKKKLENRNNTNNKKKFRP